MRSLRLRWSLLLVVAGFALACSGGRTVNVKDFGGDGGDTPASGCSDDAREEDDQVAYVLAKVTKDGEKFDATSCPGDDDFVHLLAEGRAAATIAWNESDGEIRVDMLDGTGRVLSLTGSTDLSDRTAGRIQLQRIGLSGDAYLRVRNRSGTPVRYRVEIGAVGADLAPPPPAIVTSTPPPSTEPPP